MKLNWRDASKELPKKEDTLIVLVDRTLDVHEDFYSLEFRAFFYYSEKSVRYWIYKEELPLP